MSAELEDIHEECGIFGVWGHSAAARLTYFGLHALQHRGQEGAGIVSNDNGHLIGHRGTGLLTQVFSDEREIERLKGDKAIGHVRYATAGSGGTDNIQPFIFRFHDGDMALCHNGNLTNCPSLRRKLEDEGAIFHSNSDTEVLMHLIRRSSKPTFMDKLKEALNTVHGGFAYLIMTEHAMIGALDPNGFRPLSLGRMTNGAYVLASETCALDTVGAELVRDIRPGEIVAVDDEQRDAHGEDHRDERQPVEGADDEPDRTEQLPENGQRQRNPAAQPQRVGEDFGQRGEIVDFRDAVRQQQHAEEHPQVQQEERSPCGIARRREEESQDS